MAFEKEFLKPRLELRKGHLLKEPLGKDKDNRFLGMFDDTDFGDEGDAAAEFGREWKKSDEDGLEKTNQEDMDRLIQPCIDDDEKEASKPKS